MHSAAGASHPVRTCVRIRPLTPDEVARGETVALEPRGADQRSVLVHRAQPPPPPPQQQQRGVFAILPKRRPSASAANPPNDVTAGFRFHRVFGPNETNQEVFDDAVAEIVQVGHEYGWLSE